MGPDEVYFRWGGREGASAEPEKWADAMKRWEAGDRSPASKYDGANKGDDAVVKNPGDSGDDSEDVNARHGDDGTQRRQMTRQGDESKPPGLREAPPEKDMDKRDYNSAWSDKWLMRPEVRQISLS